MLFARDLRSRDATAVSCWPLRRGLLRRDFELSRDVAALLREPKTVSIALHLVDMGITLFMQWAEQFTPALEQRDEVGRLRLRVTNRFVKKTDSSGTIRHLARLRLLNGQSDVQERSATAKGSIRKRT